MRYTNKPGLTFLSLRMFCMLDVSCIKHIYKKRDLYSEKYGLYVIFGHLGGVSVNSLCYLHLVKIDNQSFLFFKIEIWPNMELICWKHQFSPLEHCDWFSMCFCIYRHHWALFHVSLHFLLMKWTESFTLCWVLLNVLSDFTDYLIRSSPQLQIWDTAGQERFRSITQSYYRSANALILTYDITCEDSFRCLPEWLREIEQYANNQVVTILVGEYLSFNKIIFLIQKNCICLLVVLSQLQYIEWWYTF